MNKLTTLLLSVGISLFFTGMSLPCAAQPEVTAWGNMTGIRIDGQLMRFETSLRVVSADWAKNIRTGKERQNPMYKRDGKNQIITTRIDSLFFTETFTESGVGQANVEIKAAAHKDTLLAGAFLCVELPDDLYANGSLELIDAQKISFSQTAIPGGGAELLRMAAKGIRLISPGQQLEVSFGESTTVIVKASPEMGIVEVYLPLMTATIKAGQSVEKSFSMKVSGNIDHSPVTLTLDPSVQGREFAGFGGNFRLQNPTTDPPVIDYCLENLRVAWGRVEMPWRFWHPKDSITDPLAEAEKNGIHPRVQAAMEMAQRLHKLGMPVIISDWSAPNWAITGEFRFRRQPGDPWGNPLNEEKMEEIYASITAYILYMKKHYGVEAAMFSFNESDLGINVRQTDEEHTRLIRGLGKYMASKGLKTKLLLGDTADANGHPFIQHAMNDPEAKPFIGAISFHSWRGFETETLQQWADAATRMNLPLLVGEGSIDAAAWRYPDIFEEQIYALDEINLYTRILAICQPASILQWQLTADYSPLSGGGVFGNNAEPLHPTRRFYNLKQLAATPAGVYAIPVTSDKPSVNCAALGNSKKGAYAVHIVNNDAARVVTVTGIPEKVKKLKMYVTDAQRNMEMRGEIPVVNGEVKFQLEAVSFTSLMTGK
ncbi:MAG: hypothetical protein R3D00_26645 [Bacteroidia bacterium]